MSRLKKTIKIKKKLIKKREDRLFKKVILPNKLINEEQFTYLCALACIRYCMGYKKGKYSFDEFVGYVWEKLHPLYIKGERDTGFLLWKAKKLILDYIRDILHGKGWGEYSRNINTRIFIESELINDNDYYRYDEAHTPEPQLTPYQRRLALWVETRNQRIGIDMKSRIILYLYYVEGLMCTEIAKLFNLGETRISDIKNRAIRKLTIHKVKSRYAKLSRGIM
jgi:DNA-directed RNA polymerase specialized sigma24 family protein